MKYAVVVILGRDTRSFCLTTTTPTNYTEDQIFDGDDIIVGVSKKNIGKGEGASDAAGAHVARMRVGRLFTLDLTAENYLLDDKPITVVNARMEKSCTDGGRLNV